MARIGRGQPQRPIVVRGRPAADGNVTVALTGQQATWQTGTLAHTVSVSLAGAQAAWEAGSVSPAVAALLAGLQASWQTGTPTPSTTRALTGAEIVTATGTLAPALSVPLAGVESVWQQGTMTASVGGNVTVGLSGQQATFQAGSVVPNVAVALAGQQATFATGSVAVALANALAGVQAAFEQGSITPSSTGNVTVALSGLQATWQQGTLLPIGGLSGGGGYDYGAGGKPRKKPSVTHKDEREERSEEFERLLATVKGQGEKKAKAAAKVAPNKTLEAEAIKPPRMPEIKGVEAASLREWMPELLTAYRQTYTKTFADELREDMARSAMMRADEEEVALLATML